MPRYSLHAVGQDRPGIVAAVAGALAELACNLEDSRMSILHGQFAIMLVLEAPEGVGVPEVERALRPVAERFDLLVAVRPLAEQVADQAGSSEVVVSVHGADHPGIVARVAAEVAAGGGNVVELATRVVEDPAAPSYVMVLTVALAPEADTQAFARRLAAAAAEAGVRCSVAPGDADLL